MVTLRAELTKLRGVHQGEEHTRLGGAHWSTLELKGAHWSPLVHTELIGVNVNDPVFSVRILRI